jgi:hypothetical protein
VTDPPPRSPPKGAAGVSKKRRTKPRRLFKQRRLPTAVVLAIDRLTADCPELRGILTEAVAVFDSQAFWEAFILVPPYQRAATLLALRDAADALRNGKPCDFCEGKAKRIRFTAIASAEDFRDVKRPEGTASLIGFVVLCDRHFGAPESEHKRRTLDVYATGQPPLGEHPYRRPTIIGSCIGEAGTLPRRHLLEECEDCQAMVWIDQDQAERVVGEIPLFMCRGCARKRLESGRMEAVPWALIGGPL